MASITVREDRCKGCGLCAVVCPKKIVGPDTSRLNQKGYHPSVLREPDKCIGCAMCATICPDCVITVER